MEKFDNDSDGLLDMDEFKSLMNKNQKKKEVWLRRFFYWVSVYNQLLFIKVIHILKKIFL